MCISCEAGYYRGVGDVANVCIPCPAGRFSSQAGLGLCTLCSTGKHATGTKNAVCTDCVQGKYAGVQGMENCELCAAGFYQVASAASRCDQCSPGTFNNETGLISCSPCSLNFYQPSYNASACIACEVHQFTTVTGQAACTICDSAKYRAIKSGVCLDCPSYGVTCSLGVITSLENYYLDVNPVTSQVTLYDCPVGLCLDGSTCATGRLPAKDNLLCGTCDPAYTNSGTQCVICNSTNWTLIFIFIMAVWFCVLVLVQVSKRDKKDTAFAQITTYFLQVGVIYLGPASTWASWLSFLNLNVADVASLTQSGGTCITPLDPYGNVASSLATPLTVVFILAVVVALSRCYHGRHYPATDYTRTASSVALFVYVPLSQAVFTYLNCITVSGKLIMASFPAIICTDSQYFTYLPMVLVALAVVVFSPVVLVLFLFRHSRRLLGDGKTSLIASMDFKNRWGVFYERYKPENYYWTGWTLLRRTILVATYSFMQQTGPKFALISMTQLLALALQVFYWPYQLFKENMMEFISLLSLLLLGMVLGSYSFPYSTAVQVVVSMLVFVPGLGMIGVIAFDVYSVATTTLFEEEKRRVQLQLEKEAEAASRSRKVLSLQANLERRREAAKDLHRVHHSNAGSSKVLTQRKETDKDKMLSKQARSNYFEAIKKKKAGITTPAETGKRRSSIDNAISSMKRMTERLTSLWKTQQPPPSN